MMNSHTPESFDRVILGIAIVVVGPALVPAPIIATLTATPLRQATTAILAGVLIAVFAFWVVAHVRVRGSPASEGGEN